MNLLTAARCPARTPYFLQASSRCRQMPRHQADVVCTCCGEWLRAGEQGFVFETSLPFSGLTLFMFDTPNTE